MATSVSEIQKSIRQAADLIRKYDDAAKAVIKAWESGEIDITDSCGLAIAVRELGRVYRREGCDVY